MSDRLQSRCSPTVAGGWETIREDGCTLLREALSGPPVFTPEGKGHHFRGRVATGELIAGASMEMQLKWRPHAELNRYCMRVRFTREVVTLPLHAA